MLTADLDNPWASPGGSVAAWYATVDTLLAGLAPVRLRDSSREEAPFDRLDAPTDVTIDEGPLVSVLISSFRPSTGLLTSVRSVAAQTWSNLEILVVDDASGPDYSKIYEQAKAIDPRVNILTQARNQGTYGARNLALDVARGQYLTFQDSDDWSHPERIERQVALLEADPLVDSVRTHAYRVNDDLVFTRVGNPSEIVAAPTLMFRRAKTRAKIGYYDRVRKAADTEYHRRMGLALTGRSVDLALPLLFMRMGDGSLSRDEFGPGWRHPARLVYESAYAHWHQRIRSGASPYLPPDGDRRFGAPRRYQVAPSGPTQFDVVFAADWRHDGPLEREAADWLAELADQSLTIGILHVEKLGLDVRRPRSYIDPVSALADRGTVEILSYDDTVETGLTVVVDPSCLSFLPASPAGLRSRRTVILASRPPVSREGVLRAYDPQEVVDNARRGFRGDVRWSVRGEGTRRALVEAATAPVLAHDLPLAIAPGSASPRLHRPDTPVVVVVLTEESPESVAQAARIARVCSDAGTDVRVRTSEVVRSRLTTLLDGATSVLLLRSLETTQRVMLSTATDVVLVGTDHGPLTRRVVLEASALGARPIVPQAHASQNPEAAAYTAVQDVMHILSGRSSTPDRRSPAGTRNALRGQEALRDWYLEAIRD
ncbi:glycosyltransferase family 2 protein [Oerskovia flava]|uniref:glycosyltransferase family 2 protein n=1 Tax=Oerskovia flava TaxID=2986422 RepID=UPI0022409982|nr:glycosyltransferase family 2 protein [Oerskovia sp. JB1-3-2]